MGKALKKKKGYSSGGYFGRVKFDTTVNKKTDYKTSVLINVDELEKHNSGFDKKLFDKKYTKAIKGAPTYRPASHITKYSKNNSPIKIVTPNKTVLRRTSRVGPVSTYSNDPESKTVRSFKIKRPHKKYLDSDLQKKLVHGSGSKKKQRIVLTRRLLEKNKKRGGVRHISQNRVMARKEVGEEFGSATLHARSAGIAKRGRRFEHSHLIAHSFKKKKAQHHNNMNIASSESNTRVMAMEAGVRDLANKDRVAYSVSTRHKNHFELSRKHKIKTENFKITLDVNPQEVNKPHKDEMEYLRNAINIGHEVAAKKKKPDQKYFSGNSIFSKEERRKEQENRLDLSAGKKMKK